MKQRKVDVNANARCDRTRDPKDMLVELRDGTVITLEMYYRLLDEIKMGR